MGNPNEIVQVPDHYPEETIKRLVPVRARGEAMVCTAGQDMREAAPSADYHHTSGVNLTGTWSSRDDRHHWLHVNQAGVWLECLLVRVGLASRTPYATRVFSGYVHQTNKFSYVLCDDADREAIIGFFNKEEGKSTWSLSLHAPEKQFIGGFDREQSDTAPVVLPHAAAALPEAFKLQHWARPTPGELKRLQKLLAALEDPIRRYYELDVWSESITDQQEYQRRAEALDQAVGAALPEKRGALPWVPFNPRTEVFHAEAKRLLKSWELTIGGSTKSYFAWMQRIVQEAQASGTAFLNPKLPHMIQRLGIRRAPKLEYEATIRIGNYSKGFLFVLEGKGMAGVLTLKRTTAPAWEARYPIAFGGLGLSASHGKTVFIESSGTGWSTGLWNPEDVPGSCLLLDLGVTLGENTYGSTGLSIHGPSWQNRTLNLDLSGWTSNVGAEVGLSLSASWGLIGPRLDGPGEVGDLPEDVARKLEPALVELERDVADVVHFKCGSALLTDEGRDVVRRLCARDLPVFLAKDTRVKLTGHADRLDWAHKNQRLSELRAKNSKQALHDTLWGRMKAYDQVEVEGLGEQEHRAYVEEHGLQEKSNQAFRRVDVEVNGKVIARLQGA